MISKSFLKRQFHLSRYAQFVFFFFFIIRKNYPRKYPDEEENWKIFSSSFVFLFDHNRKKKKSAECAASTERDAAGRPPMRFILCGPNESLPSHWSASLDTVPSRKADGSSLACWLPTCGRSFLSLLCDPSDVCKRAARATKRSRAPLTRKRVAGRRASSAHNCLRLVVCVLFCFPVSYRFVLFQIIVSLQSE